MRNVKYKRSFGVAAISVALGATALASVGAQAADQGSDRAGPATITMELGKDATFFDGAASVKSGDELQIVNNTDPKMIGPHTFTLTKQKLIPALDKQAIKDCYKPDGFCIRVLKAHGLDFKSGNIKTDVTKAGKAGWDRSYGKRGDSWATATQDDKFSQVVSAAPGATLYYFCTVHPEMRGKIKVK